MKKIVHCNSSDTGGGVDLILRDLLQSSDKARYKHERFVIRRSDKFFDITKKIHNQLHGRPVSFTKEEISLYLTEGLDRVEQRFADYDCVVLHDPQTLPIVARLKGYKPIIWRCHIPIDANSFIWQLMSPFVQMCDVSIFSNVDYVPVEIKNSRIFYPSINPEALRNKALLKDEKLEMLKKLGIKEPYIVQVSRFDRLKGIDELVETYARLEKVLPEYEFILASNLPADDSEGREIFEDLSKKATDRVKILKLSNDYETNQKEVNTLQNMAKLVLLNSSREGFGLVVTEAMLKGKPVLARAVGGIKLQVDHGINGFLLEPSRSLYEAVLGTLENLNNEKLVKDIASSAKEKVRKNFVIDILLKNYENLVDSLLEN